MNRVPLTAPAMIAPEAVRNKPVKNEPVNPHATTLAIRIAEPFVVLRGGADRPRRRRNDRVPNVIDQLSMLGNGNSSARNRRPSLDNAHSALTPHVNVPVDDHEEGTGGHPADTEPVTNGNREEFPPAILRGLLTLKVVKPIRVRRIDLKIKGVCRTEWPEGIGPRRLEIAEETVVLDESVTYFNAVKDFNNRRATSLAPATTFDPEERPSRSASLIPSRQNSTGAAYYSPDLPLHTNNGSDSVPPSPHRLCESQNSGIYSQTPAHSSVDSLGPNSTARPSLSASQLMDEPESYQTSNRQGSTSPVGSRTPVHPKAATVNSDDAPGRFKLSNLGDAIRGKPKAKEPEKPKQEENTNRGRKKGLKALKNALTAGMSELGKMDADSDSEDDGRRDSKQPGWKEFKAGTYSWPLVLPLSSRLPPTVNCGFGTTAYRLRATVRRPGALTSNIITETEIELVAAPGDDDTEESESIVVERMWETQLSYMIAVNQKSFPVGGAVPVTIRLRPLAKVKVYRISVFLEEKVVYFALQRKLQRSENVRRITLAKMQNEDDEEPLLPILSDDPDAIAKSPLAPWFINPTSSDDSTPNCLDPIGPWEMEAVLKMPGPESRLKFTTTNPQSSIHITHVLKVVVRVDRGDDEFLDAKGKRKKWDIIVEATVHLLSHRCAQSLLPPYTQTGPVAAMPISADSGQGLARPARRDALSGYDPAAALALTAPGGSNSSTAHEMRSLDAGNAISEVRPASDPAPAPPPTYQFTLDHPAEVSARVLSTRNSTDEEAL